MTKTRILILILCISMLTGLFASCNQTETPETTEPETTALPETEPAPAELKFSENGTCEFYIVYPAEFDKSIRDIAISLRQQIKKYTGVEPKIVSDEILAKPVGDSGVEHQYEILLGPTNREASQKYTSTMRARDYAFTFEGDKVVIAGLTNDTVDRACELFISNVLIPQSKGNVGKATVVITEADIFI